MVSAFKSEKACRPLSGDGRYQSVYPDIALSGNPYRDSRNCTGCDLSAWRPGYLGHLQSDVFIPAVLSGIELFLLTHSKTIRAIHGIMEETTRSMQENGYKGFAGYRLGFYLFLAGIIISLVSAVCFFALDRE